MIQRTRYTFKPHIIRSLHRIDPFSLPICFSILRKDKQYSNILIIQLYTSFNSAWIELNMEETKTQETVHPYH